MQTRASMVADMTNRHAALALALATTLLASPCGAANYFMRTKVAPSGTAAAAPKPNTPSVCGTLNPKSAVANATVAGRYGPYKAADATAAVAECNKIAGAKVCYYDVSAQNAFVYTGADQSSSGGGSIYQMSSNCTAN